MIINFKAHKISGDVRKLVRTPMLIVIIKKAYIGLFNFDFIIFCPHLFLFILISTLYFQNHFALFLFD